MARPSSAPRPISTTAPLQSIDESDLAEHATEISRQDVPVASETPEPKSKSASNVQRLKVSGSAEEENNEGGRVIFPKGALPTTQAEATGLPAEISTGSADVNNNDNRLKSDSTNRSRTKDGAVIAADVQPLTTSKTGAAAPESKTARDEREVRPKRNPLSIAPRPQPSAALSASNLSSKGDKQQDTHVSVHIGRIEVRAAPTTEPPRATKVQNMNKNPMSLSSYLAKRSRNQR